MKVIDKLIRSVQQSSVFNQDVQVAPCCILWPDRDRQWEAIIPRLQQEVSELFVLGDYNPDIKTGPAIWLRCVIAGKTEPKLPSDKTPVLYLPGVSRQDLRAVETCDEHLKPLAELQYRGVIWSQVNSKDWTILAFLKSDQGGLGLDVAQDEKTKSAMQLALYRLLDEKVNLLTGKRLDKDFFNTMLTGGDPIRDLLTWLDQGEVFRESQGSNEWNAFVEVCKSQLAFDPDKDGNLAGAKSLAERTGPWKPIWDRYCEAPKRYSNIPKQINKVQAPSDTIFWQLDNGEYDGWPQWNDHRESILRTELEKIKEFPAHEGRQKVQEIAKDHVRRGSLVWAELGFASLAIAVEHLAELAQISSNKLSAGTIDDIANEYKAWGWKADSALLKSLSSLSKSEDVDVVSQVIDSIYFPWIEESALYLQKTWEDIQPKTDLSSNGECILFVDGLRYDCAKRLIEMLDTLDLSIDEQARWAALPSLTGTGKYVVAPIHEQGAVKEEPDPYNFEPISTYEFKKALNEAGWTIGEKNTTCPKKSSLEQQKLWVEYGNIDHEGHDRGWKLALHLESMLNEIKDKVVELISNGWDKVRIVTDHGWLLLPSGLPKSDLSSALIENKWGRCASIKSGAECNEKLYPWFWNQSHHFALAEGVSCYKKNQQFSHGGLSLQECLLLDLEIRNNAADETSKGTVEITDIVWKGLRCNVAVDGDFSGLVLDIRFHAGDKDSSIVMNPKPIKDSGIGSVVVEDEELEGKEVVIVLTNKEGQLVVQQKTVIGEGSI